MRLLRLELAGFGAFRSPTELTFDDADFFALVGPTGSGKSTILDAVCFALYGSVPRYGSENLIRYVVTLGASEARVRLDFELAGEHYIATRVARRTPKGVVATKEARLERVTGADTTEVVAGFEREMSAAVVQLLGLRFDDFTRCVALPQGDFARFLRAKGDERRELLLRLLNLGVYTDLGVTARRLEAEARSQIALIDGQLEQYAFATAEALEAARRRRVQVDGLAAEVDAAQPALAGLAAQEQAAPARGPAPSGRAGGRPPSANELGARLAPGGPCPVCDHVVERLPDGEPVTALADAERRVTHTEKAFTGKQSEHGTAEKLLAGTTAQLETLAGQRAKLAVQVEAHPDVAALDALIGRVAAAETAVKAAQAAEDETLEPVQGAKSALAGLEGAAQTARRDFTAQRDKVVALDPPAAGDGDVLADWEALAAGAAALAPQRQAAAAAARAEAATHAEARRETLAGLHSRFGALGLAVPAGADGLALVSAVATAASEAAHAVHEIEGALAPAPQLREAPARPGSGAAVAPAPRRPP